MDRELSWTQNRDLRWGQNQTDLGHYTKLKDTGQEGSRYRLKKLEKERGRQGLLGSKETLTQAEMEAPRQKEHSGVMLLCLLAPGAAGVPTSLPPMPVPVTAVHHWYKGWETRP